MPATWPIERWRTALEPLLPGAQVQVVAQTGSTNSDLMLALRDGQQAPTLRVALHQSAGRGRMGRQWSTRPGDALTFSLSLPLQVRDWSGLSLAVGVSLARSLHPQVLLKWPNDLWWQTRKLGGILIETALCGEQRHAVVGVGLNLRPPPEGGLTTAAAWLEEIEPEAQPMVVLERLLLPLVGDLQVFAQGGLAPFAAEFARRDALRARQVQLSDGSSGVAGGIDERGALLVHTATGVQAISSSEVSVRPYP